MGGGGEAWGREGDHTHWASGGHAGSSQLDTHSGAVWACMAGRGTRERAGVMPSDCEGDGKPTSHPPPARAVRARGPCSRTHSHMRQRQEHGREQRG
jgi:hypothetical protein